MLELEQASRDPAVAGGVVAAALERLRDGREIVLLSSLHDDSRAALVVAADSVDEAALQNLTRAGTGMIGLCLSDERGETLGLTATRAEARPDDVLVRMTTTISHRDAPAVGSYAHRSLTIRRAAEPSAGPEEFVSPGLITPFRARPGGVIEERGYPEAAVDLVSMAGLSPGAVQTFATDSQDRYYLGATGLELARRLGAPAVTIDDIVDYRWRTETLLERAAAAFLPTSFGDFDVVAYRERVGRAMHVALVRGVPAGRSSVLFGLHRRCLGGDVFRATSCVCQARLTAAVETIEEEGLGVVLYWMSESDRGASWECARAQPQPLTVAEARLSRQVLADLGVKSVRLMEEPKNLNEAIDLARSHGVPVAERFALVAGP